MLARRDMIKLAIALALILVSGVTIGIRFFPGGCGPDEEYRRLRATLNNLDEIRERGGRVEGITLEEGRGNDSVFRYKAEIHNEDGLAIGRLRGRRVEGFGTVKPRIQWYDAPREPGE
ncbi:MAG: hypothetical protein ACLFTT_17685 [Candidatus Hydrogenedentota bacterium]